MLFFFIVSLQCFVFIVLSIGLEDRTTEWVRIKIYILFVLFRAFPTHLGSILYFTTLKKHLFYFTTHFYIITLIPFSTLQNILLK